MAKITDLNLGIEVRKCSECEYKNNIPQICGIDLIALYEKCNAEHIVISISPIPEKDYFRIIGGTLAYNAKTRRDDEITIDRYVTIDLVKSANVNAVEHVIDEIIEAIKKRREELGKLY